jgi:hypothetical protein
MLQLGTFILMLAVFVVPLAEFFDHWDPSGFSNDTEFTVLSLIFTLCLVLIVCKLISAVALLVTLTLLRHLRQPERSRQLRADCALGIFALPLHSPPLRI